MNEGGGSRKSGSPKVSLKSKVVSPRSEEASPSEKIPLEKPIQKDSFEEKEDNSEIEHPKSEITMEVHHHPEVEKKTLKQYLLEGLMIFLAVTMGFFAESLREHIADKNKERQILEALAKDIRKDTATLHNTINSYMPAHNAWVDSADLYINSLELKGNERKIVKAIWNATVWDIYSPPEIALNILKNSGTFNLIENDKVKEEILKYNGVIDEYITYRGFLFSAEHSLDTSSTSVINRKPMRIMLKGSYLDVNKHQNGFITDADMPEGPLLKTYNKAAIINMMKKIDQIDESLNDLLGLYKIILNEEDKLLNVLKQEYDLNE